MSKVEIAAIVLAGGQSSRMGQDKALLDVDGVPLLRRVYEVAAKCAPIVYVVTPWPERYRSLALGCIWLTETPLPHETTPHGPLVGFAQGLAQVETDWVLLLACDLPRLQADVIQGWMAHLPEDRSIAAVLHHSKKGWEPLCGFYRRSCLPALEKYIAEGRRSFQGWLTTQTVLALPLAESDMLFNCNTPDDLVQP
ncbi:molybdenum cofactor guanylyltransferase [Microcoleus sp. FACHB-1515]|uniref:molybdenum cofactor guanylyltransferase n=1 Tax=Cyanophyceae TaxID=3028117 RepID=UPI001683AD84|nr:molybdenum cofactor guanylyltransferase [Microcoleus sp. FACHB-1515]MBD2090042.1 molybdenum cofactor guanylyltransferase [Microcoleus sp. FACHB-1515]